MNNKTKIIMAVSLPVLVIIVISVAVLWPKIFFHPKYDFIYTIDSVCPNYGCDYNYNWSGWSPYTVQSGQITKSDTPPLSKGLMMQQQADTTQVQVKPVSPVYPAIYRYYVASDTFEKISFEEASRLVLTDAGSAPDGCVVVNGGYNNGGVFIDIFGGRSSEYGYYIKNGSFSKQIVVQNASEPYYYNSNFHLVGWVK